MYACIYICTHKNINTVLGWACNATSVCHCVCVRVRAHSRRYTNVSLGRDVCRCTRDNKDTVVHLAPSRGHCMAFSSTIPPLQVALSFACSVASLSHSPSFQLPGWRGLHRGSLADYLLGWGRTSTCTAGHTELQCTTVSKVPYGRQEFPPTL